MKSVIRMLMFFLLLFTGCNRDEPLIPLCNPEKYFPLKIGNYWIYRYYKVYLDGGTGNEFTDSMYISSDTLMLGYRFFHLQGTFHSKPISYYLTSADGQVVSAEGYVFYECPRLIESTKQYPIMGFDFPGTINTTRFDAPVKVPAGDFDPVMLFEAHSMLNDTIWIVTYKAYYAKNVGIVKFSAKPEPDSNFESFSELIRYRVDNQRATGI